jgi:hypothetical protein
MDAILEKKQQTNTVTMEFNASLAPLPRGEREKKQ